MAGSFTNVNLSQVPVPDIVEQVDFEVILAALLADMKARDAAFDALVESDPAVKQAQGVSYREVLVRQRANDACKGVMLAYAVGSDLDQLAANYNVARLDGEGDEDLRARVQLAFEGLSTAGPAGAYKFHALGADPDVADVAPTSPSPGIVAVYVMSRSSTGVPSPEVLAKVQAALSADDVRPLTDWVQVFPVDAVGYTVEAEIEVFDGPDAEVVRSTAQKSAEAYVTAQRKIGLPATRSGLFAAIHIPGVRNVRLVQPAADVLVSETEVAICNGVSVELS